MNLREKQEAMLRQSKLAWLDRELSARAPAWVMAALRATDPMDLAFMKAIAWLERHHYRVEVSDDRQEIRLLHKEEVLSTFIWSITAP